MLLVANFEATDVVLRRGGVVAAAIVETPAGGSGAVPDIARIVTDDVGLERMFEVEIPTGDEDRGLGSGEVALAPSFSAWLDLGHWWALNTQLGIEHTLEHSETELLVRASLVYTLGRADHQPADEHHPGHLPTGLWSLIFEVDGTVGLAGGEDGVVNAEGIVGVYYGLSEGVALRAGYQFPLSSPRELDGGLTTGVVCHF